MNQVFGLLNLVISIPVKAKEKIMALLEANYRLNKLNIVAIELYIIDSQGNRIKVDVHDTENIQLTDFVEY